ncbi:transcription elongation factor SPT5-like isoform X2 [Strix aluco]|uniref:transcription elongation factor SPT5-like isoform X2 n=1 Tax=Strix aluco TaxID=111821 RepID=UPI003DA411ED
MGSAMSTGRSRTLVNPPRAPASPSSSSPAALTGPGAAGSSLEGVRIGMLWASTSRRTPGAPSPGGDNPHTPGSGIEQSSSDWVTTDIQVKDGICFVYLYDSEKVVSISSEHLEPVTPTRRNKVKVILGEDREATGILLSIDGEEGVVRMDLEEQFKILNLRSLGKLVEA